MAVRVKTAFRLNVISLRIAQLVITRPITDIERKHAKFQQIAASMKVLGLVEPVIVHPLGRGTYRVLDGRKGSPFCSTRAPKLRSASSPPTMSRLRTIIGSIIFQRSASIR